MKPKRVNDGLDLDGKSLKTSVYRNLPSIPSNSVQSRLRFYDGVLSPLRGLNRVGRERLTVVVVRGRHLFPTVIQRRDSEMSSVSTQYLYSPVPLTPPLSTDRRCGESMTQCSCTYVMDQSVRGRLGRPGLVDVKGSESDPHRQ